MSDYYDLYGTHILLSSIKDFRVIDVEFIFRPVFRECKKTLLNALGSGKKFEFVSMQPYAAIIGQQGHKSALGEYKPKDFKEALGKDLSGAVIYTIADKLNLKAFKQQKFQCVNLAGRAFTTYLDDIPTMLIWNDGRTAEVYKEDPLYALLGESTTPGIQYIPTLVIKADETYCFYGNGIQVTDANLEYEQLKQELDILDLGNTNRKKIGKSEKFTLPQIPKLHLSPKNSPNDK
ncbi:MAG: hypothetical protein IJD81_03130 [Oscillospiraceae bacterium]|nr:hypothetical protein [Oscillospiraceae bacterium]